LYKNHFADDLGDDHKLAGPQRGNPGKWCLGYRLPRRPRHTCLETEKLRRPNHLRQSDVLDGKLLAKLILVCVHVEETRQHSQGSKAR
jgi:hypothetical protein